MTTLTYAELDRLLALGIVTDAVFYNAGETFFSAGGGSFLEPMSCRIDGRLFEWNFAHPPLRLTLEELLYGIDQEEAGQTPARQDDHLELGTRCVLEAISDVLATLPGHRRLEILQQARTVEVAA